LAGSVTASTSLGSAGVGTRVGSVEAGGVSVCAAPDCAGRGIGTCWGAGEAGSGPDFEVSGTVVVGSGFVSAGEGALLGGGAF
jgi:hypothetical protein